MYVTREDNNMSRVDGSVLLVGSIPGSDAQEAMRLCARELGDRLSFFPDGETGFRKIWINFLAATRYAPNDALETVNQPEPVNPDDPDEWREASDYWVPRGYHDHWQFRIRENRQVYFDQLGYAQEAISSYQVFKQLRVEGLVSADQRFMVAMPMCESAVRPFLGKAGENDYEILSGAYTEAMSREIPKMLEEIPAHDLAIQWDICMEMLAVDVDDNHSVLFPWKPRGEAMERYAGTVRTYSNLVPGDVFFWVCISVTATWVTGILSNRAAWKTRRALQRNRWGLSNGPSISAMYRFPGTAMTMLTLPRYRTGRNTPARCSWAWCIIRTAWKAQGAG